MDDMLIVSRSERFAARTAARRSRHRVGAPLGVNLGIATGAAAGLLAAQAFGLNPIWGLFLGIAMGLAIGGLAGRFLVARKRPFQRRFAKTHYEGMPFDDEETPADADPSKGAAAEPS